MNTALAAHGPDGNGIWTGGHAGLGYRLMCFTPEDRLERQPASGADGNCTLVVDGRVDNRPELMRELGITSEDACGMPDSAFILRAYEKWGPASYSHLVGNFAFALYDRHENHLVVARSAMSKRTLYYHADSKTLAFASAPGGLFALPWIPRAIDPESLADFLVWVPRDRTKSYFAGISELPDGHSLTVRPERSTVQEYWQPYLRPETRFPRDSDYIEAFIALFERVVADQMRSLSPVGVAMSGGLDSSSVAVTAARLLEKGRRLPVFTQVPRAGFDKPLEKNKYADETPLVQSIARKSGQIDLNFVRTDSRLLLDDIQPYLDAVEGPLRAPWNRIWWEAMLRQVGGGNIRVLLTGGSGNLTISRKGDGLFPQLIRQGKLIRAYREAKAFARQGGGGSGISIFARRAAHVSPLPLWLLARALARPGDPVLRSGSPWQSFSPINTEFARVFRVRERAKERGHDFFGRARYKTLKEQFEIVRQWCTETPATKGYEALFGVQDRDVPADSRIVEFCVSLPEEQHLHGGVPRSLIRRAMAEQLPREVIANRRTGVQLADWSERAIAGRCQMLEELVRLERSELARTVLDLPRVRSLLENVPESVSGTLPPQHRSFLGAAFMTGAFLRWVESPRRMD